MALRFLAHKQALFLRYASILCLIASSMAHAYASQPPVSMLRIDYIFNFTKYVDWPDSWVSGAESTITFCVISDSEFHQLMAKRLEGRITKGHPVHIVRGDVAKDSCHITYVQGRMPSKIASKSTILISDSNGRRARDSSVILHEKGSRIQFEVNLDNLGKSGVKVSSELLKLARVKR